MPNYYKVIEKTHQAMNRSRNAETAVLTINNGDIAC